MVILKRPTEIQKMREAGRVVARGLDAARAAIKPGVTTWELDQIVARVFEQHNARPAFLGYPPGSDNPFPATITASVNNEILHGIPNRNRVLNEGDIVSIDTGCHLDGYVGDAAFTAGVGTISTEAQRLLDVTQQALYLGIQNATVGNQTRDLAQIIRDFVEAQDFNVIRGYSGHGVGQQMHEEPEVPVWWPKGWDRIRLRQHFHSVKLRPGMTFAIEPMVSAGDFITDELADGWTVVMADGSLSAHFEHTIAVTEGEATILTEL